MNMSRRDHLSFLLRLWQAESKPDSVWRASLEDPATGERKGFADVESLAQFLKSLIDETESAGNENEQTSRFSLKP